ncbi:DUF3780 domain-containing protein [Sinorhizobium meliloti]|uniref:anti-phage-associated DUF3780 domain-containing protein n=1 Tax=Rhizobium meliloti TaxID=382 RepID=UPI000B49DF98|nr:anti-phage-associated DUF3780 domain-containing protein [Sinorhizobium meliloti]ASP98421.1 DUF3780 domain-containing protein [Sinorhizobium meliloti]MQV66166.1 DUF3780 domain-containing protein [Sinorhizobium meliloti]RVQ39343.1 DUF3780 domain-containing protein [Sinorhizobium meliloti]
MSETSTSKTIGFGVPDAIDPHHFVVRIPRGSAGQIEIIERFGINAQSTDDEEVLRCRLSRSAWAGIKEEATRVLNDRLREKKLKPSRWSAGDNKVERLLGRELCLLAWAVEAAREDEIPTACSSWAALKPEERWWLFRMCDNAGGTADDADFGWRKAVHIALTEVLDPVARKKRRKKAPASVDLFSLPTSKD